MNKRAMIATATFVSSLVMAGCQQDPKAPEPVRPVLSMVLEPRTASSPWALLSRSTRPISRSASWDV